MNVVVTVEHRFEQTPDGAVWTQTQFPRPSWEPYLRVFDSVRVVARVLAVDQPRQGWKRADGDVVTFAPIPYFVGPWQYLRKRGQVRRAVQAALGPEDAVILRVPSTLSEHLLPVLRRDSRPYAVEVVGDPQDVFAPGANGHILAPFFRVYFPRRLRSVCKDACLAAYVTRAALQRRYPCPQGEVGFSDVEISDAALMSQPRPMRPQPSSFRAVMVGTLAQLYKAPDVLLDAVAACRRGGLALDLEFVGDGQYRPRLEEQARRLGIAEHVRFRGQLGSGAEVRAVLDQADLFILPSHQEGLPRAMVEAMARGLPCIGSTVGGIPELLPAEDMIPPGNAEALAAKIREVLANPDRLARMSERNLNTAREYHADRIAGVRRAFYEAIKEKTESWLRTRRHEPCPV